MKRLFFLLLILVGYSFSLAQTYQVTFNLPVSGYVDSLTQVALQIKNNAGTFSDYYQMSDSDSDGVFSVTVTLNEDLYYYQFYVRGQEELIYHLVYVNADKQVYDEFNRAKSYDVTISMQGEDGNPISNAGYGLQPTFNYDYRFGETDNNGIIHLTNLEEDRYIMGFGGVDVPYVDTSLTFFVYQDTTFNFVLPRKPEILMRFRDPNGNPLPQVYVYLENASTYRDYSFSTDYSGDYVFYLNPGTYDMYYGGGLYDWHDTTITIPDQENVEFTFILVSKPYTDVTIKVDDGILPLPGSSVKAYTEDEDLDCYAYIDTVADSNAMVRFRVCRSIMYFSVFNINGFARYAGRVALNSSDTTIIVHLSKLFPTLIRVYDTSGPLSSVWVESPQNSTNGIDLKWWDQYYDQTRLGDGEFLFYLPEGNDTLIVHYSGWEWFDPYLDFDTVINKHHYWDTVDVMLRFKDDARRVNYVVCADSSVCDSVYVILEKPVDQWYSESMQLQRQGKDTFSIVVTQGWYRVRYGCTLKYNNIFEQTYEIYDSMEITQNTTYNLYGLCDINRTITIKCVNNNNEPIQGVYIDVMGFRDISLVTDSLGMASFNSVAGQYLDLDFYKYPFRDTGFSIQPYNDTLIVVVLDSNDLAPTWFKVVDGTNRSPVPGAKITYFDKVLYTDSSGIAKDFVAVKEYFSATARKHGYRPYTRSIYVFRTSDSDTTVFYLTPGYTTVIKTVMNGQPLGNVVYNVYSTSYDTINEIYTSKTNADGLDTIICKGSYDIYTYGQYKGEINPIIYKDTVLILDLVPNKNVNLTLVAKDSAGNPLTGVWFKINNYNYIENYGAITDKHGIARINVPCNKYYIDPSSSVLDTLHNYRKQITLVSDTTINFVFGLAPSKYIYVDDYVSPVENARVQILDYDFEFAEFDTVTNEQGLAVIPVITPGPEIFINKEGYLPMYDVLWPNRDTFRFSLFAIDNYNIDFWVTDSANTPIAGAGIKLFNKKYYTDASGHFYTKMTNGDFIVKTVKSGYAPLITFFSVHSDTTIHIMLGPGDYTDVTQIGDNLTVYPNPAHRCVFVANALGMRLNIFDITGKTVVSERIYSDLQRVDVERLPAGVYLLRLENGSNVKTFKLIVR